jgi:predicted ATPase
MQQRVVITGGPGTGKTTVINELSSRNFNCMHEISRQVTLDARENGIDQFFMSDPLMFSKLLLEGREQQYRDAIATNHELIFFDRGIPDVPAYMDFMGTAYSNSYNESSLTNRYATVFLMPPWAEIYLSDNERYESYEQSLVIYKYLKSAYIKYGYTIIEVPFGSVENRTDFILKQLLII